MTTITFVLAITASIDNRTKDKPKAKRGRPRKNTPKPHKIIHQLDGE